MIGKTDTKWREYYWMNTLKLKAPKELNCKKQLYTIIYNASREIVDP